MSWGLDKSVDAIINLSTQTTVNNRSSKYNKQVNYNLYNSSFEEKDFETFTDSELGGASVDGIAKAGPNIPEHLGLKVGELICCLDAIIKRRTVSSLPDERIIGICHDRLTASNAPFIASGLILCLVLNGLPSTIINGTLPVFRNLEH